MYHLFPMWTNGGLKWTNEGNGQAYYAHDRVDPRIMRASYYMDSCDL